MFFFQWGLNVVRVGFHWHMVEYEPGIYNQSYINDLVDFVARLNQHDIYVILDMHQDCWSPRFCNAHGIPAMYSNGYSTDYNPGGSKAYPEPVVKPTYNSKGEITNCNQVGKLVFGWATCYFTYSVGVAAQRLYDNDETILEKFGEFWQMIALKVKDFPNILGYELLNEPWLGNVPLSFDELIPTNPYWDLWFPKVADRKNMVRLYKTLHEYIRLVDNESIIFFEPATGGNYLDAFPVGFDEGPGGVEYNNRQALAYHIYCPFIDSKQASSFIQYILANISVETCDILDDALYNVRKSDTERLKVAGFLTEFGNAGDGRAAEDIINFAAGKMDEFFHGWSYWYINPDPKNKNTSVSRALARPYPHCIAGDPKKYSFNPRTKKFSLEYFPCSGMTCANVTEIYTSLKYVYYSAGMNRTISTNISGVQDHFNDTTQIWYIEIRRESSVKELVTLEITSK